MIIAAIRKKQRDAQDDLVIALKVVDELNEQFGLKILVDFLTGKQTKEMKDFRFDQKPLFGAGKEKEDIYWYSVLRLGLMNKFLYKEIEQYGLIKMTESGHAFIKNPSPIKMAVDRDFESDGDVVIAAKSAALDNTLLKMLKEVRLDVARMNKVKPWVVFFDPSLEDMATQYPISMEDLTNISGVSQGKAIRYGEPFIELIKQYVEENDIERPTDFVVKQVADKSRMKVSIIQGIDKKLPLEDIATSNKLSMEDLMDELNIIVSSGTKLNIDYYIEENVDEYSQEDIYEYFMEADSESVDEAYAELKEDDVTLDEVKLVRLKFLSEMAN